MQVKADGELIEKILAEYPRHHFLWSTLRYMALNCYSACGAGENRKTGFARPDSIAVLLTRIDERSELTRIIGQWIETELRPEDRGTLIKRWRGWRWNSARWSAMIESLKAYVGHACASGGGACAGGRAIRRGA
jgi:hypothetical protein